MLAQLAIVLSLTLTVQSHSLGNDDAKIEFLMTKIAELTDNVKQLQNKVDQLESEKQNTETMQAVLPTSTHEIPDAYNASFNNKVVAFHVYMSYSFYVGAGARVVYDTALMNTGYYGGGIFTCPSDGLYLFSMNGRASSEDAICELGLHVDSVLKMKVASRYTGGAQGSAASTIVTRCYPGQQVDVRAMYGDASCVYGMDNMFAGYFLQPMAGV